MKAYQGEEEEEEKEGEEEEQEGAHMLRAYVDVSGTPRIKTQVIVTAN